MQSNNGGFNLGGINATGQIMETSFSMIDKDTPRDVYLKQSPVDGKNMQLVFSDEFEVEGRSFYPVRCHFGSCCRPPSHLILLRVTTPSGKLLICITGLVFLA